MLTKWGYEVAGTLQPIAGESEFDDFTAGKYSADTRVPSLLEAASEAVRNYCGWHVAPEVQCTCTLTAEGAVADLPLRDVTAVSSVEEDGQPVEFDWRRCGMVRKRGGSFSGSWDGVTVRCTAGTEADPALKRAVCAIAENMLTVSQTAAQESAGNVSITYRGESLSERDMMALEPYRLVM